MSYYTAIINLGGDDMQINRLFEMVYLLLNKESITAGELARQFEVSPRTIYRDVELLSSAGIPIYMTKGKGGGISLLPDFILNKAVLTDDEKADILSALHAVDSVNLERTSTAVKKLSTMFGKESSDWVEVDFSGWANGREESETFANLKASILKKQVIQFLYHSGEGSLQRVVEPLKLCFKGQDWYLYAYCRLRFDYRFFKLRRMKELSILPEVFERPIPGKIFDKEKVLQNNRVTITLKISKEMAYRVYDEFTEYELLPDGGFLTRISMAEDEGLYYYLATFGEHCEVLHPENIRLQMKERLQKTFHLYL
jgi:predicted DNA-binding transcriptional regulator YafY